MVRLMLRSIGPKACTSAVDKICVASKAHVPQESNYLVLRVGRAGALDRHVEQGTATEWDIINIGIRGDASCMREGENDWILACNWCEPRIYEDILKYVFQPSDAPLF